METKIIELPHGRDLAWLEAGDPGGTPVFVFHGTPGSRLQVSMSDADAAAAGVRLIAPDRPGYGHSTFVRRRQLIDWPDDVRRLADHLGIDRYAVAGISGGGPHAAVCARYPHDRVTAAAIVSGVAPIAEPGTEDGMMPVNQLLTRLSRRAGMLPLPVFGLMTAAGRRWPDRVMATMRKQVPAADAEVLERADVQRAFLADFARASHTAGRAAAQDFALFTRDWGFRLEDIAVPVHVWQGDADRNVPAAHGRRQAAAIPGAVLHECPGEAHLLAVPRFSEIVRTLLAAVGTAAGVDGG